MGNNETKFNDTLVIMDASITEPSLFDENQLNQSNSLGTTTRQNPDKDVWEPVIGAIFDGKYKIEQKLGEGGMGIVYKAKHIFIDRPVAIKFLRKEFLTDTAAIERFKLEARAAARIHHPNVTTILDFGIADGVFYLVMEYLEGYSLRQQLKTNGPLNLRDTIKIISQVCDALEAAHKSNIIHKDLKPDNIFLHIQDETEQVKVLDFGIAEMIGKPTDEHENSYSFSGTPQYMSPEQCQNDPLTPTTDLYSLGIILFEMLTGQLPFNDTSAVKIALKQLTSPPPKITDVLPTLPIEFDNILSKILSKNPEKRYQNSLNFSEDLQKAEALFNNVPINLPESLPGEPIVVCSNPKCAQIGKMGNKRCPRCQALSIGALLRHRYLIEKMVGKGGFGTTYLVKDVDCFDEQRILKELTLNLKDDDPNELKDMAERLFKREAQVLLNLHHKGIPRLYAYFADDNFSYLVQDFIPGQTLSEELKKRKTPISEEEALFILSSVTDILDYLHSHNPPVIHRDIKPHNLMRHQDGRIMLIDFGAVCQAVANPQASHTVIGSLGYAPPEQFLGQTMPQSDLYALGASLIYLLTGVPPRLLLTNSLEKLDWELQGKVTPSLLSLLKDLVTPELKKRLPNTNELKTRLHGINKPISSNSDTTTVANNSSANSRILLETQPLKTTPTATPKPSLSQAFAKITGTLPNTNITPAQSNFMETSANINSKSFAKLPVKSEQSTATQPTPTSVAKDYTNLQQPKTSTEPLKSSAPSLAQLLSSAPQNTSKALPENNMPPPTPPIDFQAVAHFSYEVESMLRLIDFGSYFAILSVTADSSNQEITEAYQELSEKFHPNKYLHLANYNPNLQNDLKKISARLAEAFETLIDQNKRALYKRSFRTGTFEQLKPFDKK